MIVSADKFADVAILDLKILLEFPIDNAELLISFHLNVIAQFSVPTRLLSIAHAM